MKNRTVFGIAAVGTALIVSLVAFSSKKGSYMQIDQNWVNQKLVQWAPTSIHPIDFCAQFVRASYGNPSKSYNTANVLNAELQMLLALNSTSIRADIGYAYWLQNQTTIQNMLLNFVSDIKNTKKFTLADAASESYRQNKLLWTQFKQAWIQRVRTMAMLTQPDSYIVIKEPGFYFGMIADFLFNPAVQSPQEWVTLCTNLISTVKSVSPRTLCGVALSTGSSFDLSLLKHFITIPSLDFIGYDIYGANGYNQALSYNQQYGSGGKPIWSAECWDTTDQYAFDPSRAQLDASWIKAHYYFCQSQIPMVEMNTFISDPLAMYNQPTTEAALVAAYSQRQPVFTEYQKIIAGSP